MASRSPTTWCSTKCSSALATRTRRTGSTAGCRTRAPSGSAPRRGAASGSCGSRSPTGRPRRKTWTGAWKRSPGRGQRCSRPGEGREAASVPRSSVEASRRHPWYLLQGQERSHSAGLVRAGFGDQCPIRLPPAIPRGRPRRSDRRSTRSCPDSHRASTHLSGSHDPITAAPPPRHGSSSAPRAVPAGAVLGAVARHRLQAREVALHRPLPRRTLGRGHRRRGRPEDVLHGQHRRRRLEDGQHGDHLAQHLRWLLQDGLRRRHRGRRVRSERGLRRHGRARGPRRHDRLGRRRLSLHRRGTHLEEDRPGLDAADLAHRRGSAQPGRGPRRRAGRALRAVEAARRLQVHRRRRRRGRTRSS